MKEKAMWVLSGRRLLAVLATLMLVAGCASRGLNRAPVEDRTSPAGVASNAKPSVPTPVTPPQGFENAGKPGYYTVKPGDTLIRIALEHGQSAQDIARWSQVKNPNRIEVGQVLRVEPPAGEAGVVVQAIAKPRVVAQSVNESRPLAMANPNPSPPPAAAAAAPIAEIDLVWPAQGSVVAGFDEVKNKGLDIAGEAGSPVVAAADGRVVYVGSGLRGYGNLIIIKHDNVYLTAYAHNQSLMVKEDQAVSKGQQIAEMGKSDSETVKLHFELRRQGKPVDPSKYLAAR